MMGKTHKMIAAATASILNLNQLYLVGAWVFATLPDIDILTGNHRRFTHSLLSLSIFSAIAWLIFKPIGICFAIGYGTHIIADSCTKSGVPLLYPYKKMYGIKSITTGLSIDWIIFYICIAYLFAKIKTLQ